ncbi:MAG: helix-turn-helix domain-containing protein [Dyella sp.]
MTRYSDEFAAALGKAGMSQRQLAAALGVTAANINHWKSGLRPIPADKAMTIARLIGSAPERISKDFAQIASTSGFETNGSAEPISNGEATEANALPPGMMRVPIRGSAVVGVDGFWTGLESEDDLSYAVMTKDPAAYAIRITGRRYAPVISPGECVLIEPGSPLRVARKALVVLHDGRHAIRNYLSHDRGVWTFTAVLDSNDVLELPDGEVKAVLRIMSTFDTE